MAHTSQKQIHLSITNQCKLAFLQCQVLSQISTENKNKALNAIKSAILENIPSILTANALDIEEGKCNGLSPALIDRLTLTKDRIAAICSGIDTIINLKDPIGEIIQGWKQPNGLEIKQVRVPLGVIGIVYEARPNVTVDTIALAIKSGNCIVLRGSSTAKHSNIALVNAIKIGLKNTGVPENAIQLIENIKREALTEFLTQRDYLSLLIPRGNSELIQRVVNEATVPTVETGIGNCHIYIDKTASLDKAISICINAKVQRPSVCNAVESILIHHNIASKILPTLLNKLQEHQVSIKGCEKTQSYANFVETASEQDWQTEYLDLIVAIKVVDSVSCAIEHINTYGSKHSEAIISNCSDSIDTFTNQVDAAAILVNASTRFTDGEQFGFGAEMGISTQKLHVRGPVGLQALTSIKYVVKGQGQVRP